MTTDTPTTNQDSEPGPVSDTTDGVKYAWHDGHGTRYRLLDYTHGDGYFIEAVGHHEPRSAGGGTRIAEPDGWSTGTRLVRALAHQAEEAFR